MAKKKSKSTTLTALQSIRVDWGAGKFCTKTHRDKSKYSRKQKHKNLVQED